MLAALLDPIKTKASDTPISLPKASN